ncbi:hypothetical protein JYU34_010815 [Plutella xylostella]|uniref:Uncharacterized protein n=1 Tax=Plutella xylostella TaxID=51655 RepID=A0ABQ7QFA8_PLUXY|nr:hypothetical protein JYU34_010815 [Plutella xylostella]
MYSSSLSTIGARCCLHEVLLDLKTAPLKTVKKLMKTFYYSLQFGEDELLLASRKEVCAGEETVLLNRIQEEFHSWSQDGGHLKTILDQFLADFTRVLDTQPAELLDKLLINMKVFLEYIIEADVAIRD